MMLSRTVSRPSITPMQPRSFPATCTVTKRPRRMEKQAGSGPGILAGLFLRAPTIVERARASMARRSSAEKPFSGRDDILGLCGSFHHAQLSALLDAIIQLVPETVKILRGRDQRAGHHQPHKNLSEGLQIRTIGACNQHR